VHMQLLQFYATLGFTILPRFRNHSTFRILNGNIGSKLYCLKDYSLKFQATRFRSLAALGSLWHTHYCLFLALIFGISSYNHKL
jgi:hypothetical protein